LETPQDCDHPEPAICALSPSTGGSAGRHNERTGIAELARRTAPRRGYGHAIGVGVTSAATAMGAAAVSYQAAAAVAVVAVVSY
jgi:hypothetical protein